MYGKDRIKDYDKEASRCASGIKRMITDPRYRHTDANGYHYIYYPNSTVMADLNTTKICVISMFKELESKHLIYREALNGGSPKKIYLIGEE